MSVGHEMRPKNPGILSSLCSQRLQYMFADRGPIQLPKLNIEATSYDLSLFVTSFHLCRNKGRWCRQ